MGIPQERIAQRLGIPGITERFVQTHLPRFSELKNGVNSQLERGFGVNTIAEKLGCAGGRVGGATVFVAPPKDTGYIHDDRAEYREFLRELGVPKKSWTPLKRGHQIRPVLGRDLKPLWEILSVRS